MPPARRCSAPAIRPCPSSSATVAQHQPRQRHQIGRRPVAVHERLADADVAAGQRAQEEPLVVDDERRVELVAVAEPVGAVADTPR